MHTVFRFNRRIVTSSPKVFYLKDAIGVVLDVATSFAGPSISRSLDPKEPGVRLRWYDESFVPILAWVPDLSPRAAKENARFLTARVDRVLFGKNQSGPLPRSGWF